MAILTACKRLTSFSFDAGYICLDNQFESTFLVSEIHRLHGASIESLSFSSGDSSEELGTLGDLRCLSSLKDLRTSQDDLLGECYNSICENCVALDSDHSRHKDHDVYRCDRMRPSCRGCRRSQRPCVYPHRPETVIQPQFSEILPWSLETLVIWRCDESILEKLHEIVAVVPEHLPVLKNVVIEVMNYYHEPFDTLSEAFKLKNVCLRIDLPRPPSVENTGVGSTEYDDLSIPNYSGPVR